MIRKATVKDAGRIQELVKKASEETSVLPRSLNSIYECVRDFVVFEENGMVVACCALHVTWEDLAEIRSLVVSPEKRGSGIGLRLIDFCLEEARQGLGVNRVFLLTGKPDYFQKLGFHLVDKATLPHKIWTDCIQCVYFPNCCEEAMLKEI